MNRIQLLKALNAQGYTDENPTLESVEAFVKSFNDGGGLVLMSKGAKIDIAKAWADEGKKPATVDIGDDLEDDADQKQMMADRKAWRAEKAKRDAEKMAGAEIKVGAFSRRHATDAQIKSYNAKPREAKSFADAEQAVHFGLWMKSICTPRLMSEEDSRVLQKANIGTTNTAGGALIPEEFLPQLIDLKELRGVASKLCPPIPMSGDKVTLPRRTGGLTVIFPGEGGTITESNPTFNNVNVIATTMATLTQVSNQLWNDSAISMGDFLGREIMYAFADKEDECLINGTGASTYGHMTGLRSTILNLSATRANIAGLVVASGNLFSEFELTDFNSVVGLCPAYVTNPVWLVHKRFFETVCGRIAARPGASGGAGGTTATEMAGYRLSGGTPTWLGYPVVFSQVMPRADANDQVCALFGDFGQAAKTGLVNGSMEIATSDQFAFNLNNMTIRGVQRWGCAVHDVGNADATEANRVAGPVVGLLSAAS